MKYIFSLVCAVLLSSSWVMAQKDSLEMSKLPSYSPPAAITVAYYGETVLHSGIKIGYEQPISPTFMEANWDRFLFVSGNIGYVSHRTVHRSLFANAELGYRFFPYGQLRLGAAAGLGILRYALASPAYEQQTDGSFEQISAGGLRFMPSFALELGRQSTQSASWYTRPALVFLRPHNIGSLVQIIFEFGVSFPLLNN